MGNRAKMGVDPLLYIYICVYIRRYAHIQKKNHVRPFPRKREPADIVTPSGPGMVAVTILLATVRSFPPRSSRPPRPGMVAVTILVGHCAPFPPILSRPPCLGMVAVTILGGQCAPLHAQNETSQDRHTFPVRAWGHTARKIILG